MIRHLSRFIIVVGTALLFSQCASQPSTKLGAPYSDAGNESRMSAKSRAASAMAPCAPADRPGLATGWGAKVNDKVGSTIFEREPGRPIGVAKVYYNNSEGAQAMAGQNYEYATSFRDYAGGIFRMGLRNNRGGALSAYRNGEHLICLGESGDRYAVEVENLSNHRLEFIVTVDGLDVLSGQPGSLSRRGYILNPGERNQIKGWRTSMNEVASFKFGSVEDSYADRRAGDSRNVGVIGCAVIGEKGTRPAPYSGTEVYRRLHADPFVASPSTSGFAAPPTR